MKNRRELFRCLTGAVVAGFVLPVIDIEQKEEIVTRTITVVMDKTTGRIWTSDDPDCPKLQQMVEMARNGHRMEWEKRFIVAPITVTYVASA